MGGGPGGRAGEHLHAPGAACGVSATMHLLFGLLAVLFLLLGIIGVLGDVSLVFWPLSGACVWLAVKVYPRDHGGPDARPTFRL